MIGDGANDQQALMQADFSICVSDNGAKSCHHEVQCTCKLYCATERSQ